MEAIASKFHVVWQRRNQATQLRLVHTHTQAPLLRTHTVKEDEGEQSWGGAL
jgi:hypothetical protein